MLQQGDDCPRCGSVLNWVDAGQDEFGRIKIVGCNNCGWDEEQD